MSQQVNVSELKERSNYRQFYEKELVESTAVDMRQFGFLEQWPITVYRENKQYIIIDGHTRYQSALLAALYDIHTHIPHLLVWIVIVDKPTDAEFILMQITANSKRRTPDIMSEAIGFQSALDTGSTLDQLCAATSHNKPYVQRRLDLLKLNALAREMIRKDQLPITYAIALIDLNSNFQDLALKAYNTMTYPSLDNFKAIVAELFNKQAQCSLFDLPMFGGELVVYTAPDKPEKKKSAAQLAAELDAEKRARAADRAYAKLEYAKLYRELIALKKSLPLGAIAS